MRRNGDGLFLVTMVGLVALGRPVMAAAGEEAGGGESGEEQAHNKDLAKAVQNPVADLISIPLQNNTSYNIGPNNRAQNTLNIEPVVPIHLGDKLLLITRTILPVVYQPDVTAQQGGTSGVGDLNPSFFFSPAKQGKLIFGVGPTFLIPTATQQATGTGKWSVGPAAVALIQPHPWTIGVLASQLWSFAGPSDRSSVNTFSLQYFVNYNLAHAWYLASSPIITANFAATGGDAWTVPFGGGVGKIFRLGKLPLNGQVQGFYNVRTNDDTIARWQLRVQLAFLFPTGHEKKHKPEEKHDTETASAARATPAGPRSSPPAPAPALPTVGGRR
jgi:hypothetical protein